MLVPLINSQIYAALEKLLIPAKLPGSWDAVTFPGYGETAPGSESYLAALTAQFAPADLAAAGVVMLPAGPDAQPELHPDLQVAGKKWLALRTTPSGAPFDFLTDTGSLSGRLPVLASQDDHRVRQLLTETECDLLVASTVEDAAALLAAGLPATISAGVAQLCRGPLREFMQAFELTPPKKAAAASPPKPATGQPAAPFQTAAASSKKPAAGQTGAPAKDAAACSGKKTTADQPGVPVFEPAATQLIVVAWSPAQLTLAAPGQESVRDFCEDLYHKLAVHHDFGWWQPNEQELARLSFAVRTLDKAGVGEHLLESLNGSKPIVRPLPQAASPKPEKARAAVEPGKRSFINPLASEQHAEQWRKRVDEKVLGPLLEQAEACPCPLARNLRFVHFGISVALQNMLPKVVAAFGPANKRLDLEDMNLASPPRLQALVDSCAKLTKEIQAAEAGQPCRSCGPAKVPDGQKCSQSAGG